MTLNTGVLQSCALSPLLYSKTTTAPPQAPEVRRRHYSVGLISNGNESVYRQEVEQLVQPQQPGAFKHSEYSRDRQMYMTNPNPITPIRYLFGTEPDRTLDPISAKRIGLISYILKKCILLNLNHISNI